ncbi:putative membrane protein [Lactobacillus colini]|uniref:Membrane protein n=1 Tax=Lactobacillus colini TaxID=1819254 RepID=A0ABS4MF31_9LACO|nr:YibE/F family protein [Lactobacillus colini]MBP2058278.1 putative membrane protein [Lactobacillus colini]
MNTLLVLTITLAILMTVISGETGLRSFFSIIINVVLLIFVAMLISWGLNIPVITLIFVPLKLATIIFAGTENKTVGKNAFLSSLLVCLVLISLIFVCQYFAQAAGMGLEVNDVLMGQSQQPGIDYSLIAITVAIFSTLGAIAEAAVSITAGLVEIKNSKPTITKEELIQSGTNIGKDIIGTSMNTILFGLFGSVLSLILWFYPLNYSWGEILNDKLVINELLIMMYSLIGVLLIIPLATHFLAHTLTKK